MNQREDVNRATDQKSVRVIFGLQVAEKNGERGRNRTYNLLIKSQSATSDSKQNKPLPPADYGKVRQSPQPPRNKTDCTNQSGDGGL